MIKKERSWVVELPEGVTFQELVDQKKIIQHEIFTELSGQVLRIIEKKIPLPEHSKVERILMGFDIFCEEFSFTNKEVKYHEGMSIEKHVAVDKIEEIIFEAIRYV